MTRRGTTTLIGRLVTRMAFEHPSEKALNRYLKKYPGADKSKHTVKGDGDEAKAKPDEPSKGSLSERTKAKVAEAKKKYGKELKKVKQQAKKELATYDKVYVEQLDQKMKDEEEWAAKHVADVKKEMAWTDEEYLENMKPGWNIQPKPSLEQYRQNVLKEGIKNGELPEGSSMMDMAKYLNAESKRGYLEDAKENGFDDPVKYTEQHIKKDLKLMKERVEYSKKQWESMPKEQKMAVIAAPKAAEAYVEAMDESTKKEYKRVIDAWGGSSSSPEAHQLQGYFDTFEGVEGDVADEDLDKDETPRGCPPSCVKKNREIGKKSKKLREFAEDSYSYTQAFYEEMGVKELTLWRGTHSQASGKMVGEEIDLQTREVSSWSTSAYAASNFGRVVEIKVPVDKVFASAATFPDFDYEEEAMIIGAGSVKGYVDSPSSISWIAPFAAASMGRRGAKKLRFTPEDEDWLKHKPKSFREKWEEKMKKRNKKGSVSRRGTKTAMAKRVVAENSEQAYKRVRRDVDGMTKRLERAMTKHDGEFKKDPTNWGLVGDLGHVYEQLVDLVEFLGG